MMTSVSLCIDKAGGVQVIRRPRATDAVGAALRDAFPAGHGLPRDIVALVQQLDGTRRPH